VSDETRVLLVKPGDVLLIGNIGFDTDPTWIQKCAQHMQQNFGIRTVLFAADIDVAMVPGCGHER
jgi:hypothetical protein